MKDTDLLLTDDERTVAWNEGVESGRMDWIWAGAEAVARAQAAKVLAVLLTEARGPDYDEWHFVQGAIQDTGLTWPVGALGDESGCPECGSAAKYYSMPHIHVSIPPKEG